jgi:hypothetical protein
VRASAEDPSQCGGVVVIPGAGLGIGTDLGNLTCCDGTSPASQCSFSQTNTVPLGFPLSGLLGGLLPGQPLPQLDVYTWYLQDCASSGDALIAVPIGMAIINGQVVSPGSLAISVRNLLQLPIPRMHFNPDVTSSAGAATMANLPTWWWSTRRGPIIQVAANGPVNVTVTATPLSLQWDPGDAQPPATCAGPGIPWQQGLSDNDPRACTFTYNRSSAVAAGDRFTARATMTWGITFTGSGGLNGTCRSW